MSKSLSVAAVLAVCASSTFAQSYICSLKAREGGFIPTTFAMDIAADGKAAIVYDPIIAFVHKKPIPAQMRKKNNGDLELRWRLTIPANPIDARTRYRATFNQAKNTIAIAADIRHADNFERGRGQCKLDG